MAIRPRNLNPPKYQRYQTYKRWLREEFDYSCCFCDLWESEKGGSHVFAVEHYRPKKRFPKRKTDYNNLLYACPRCNVYKSSYWPTRAQRAADMYILNLCEHDVEIHIDKTNPKWTGISSAGSWNIIKLRLTSRLKEKIRKNRRTATRLLAQARVELADAEAVLRQARQQRNNIVKLQATRTRDQLLEEIEFLDDQLRAEQETD